LSFAASRAAFSSAGIAARARGPQAVQELQGLKEKLAKVEADLAAVQPAAKTDAKPDAPKTDAKPDAAVAK